MKTIKVYEIELVEYLENKINGLKFVKSNEEIYISYILNQDYDRYKKEIEKAIESTGYCYCDYEINDIDV